MKKSLVAILFVVAQFVLAQNIYNFDYRLDYQFEGGSESSKDVNFVGKHYIPQKFTEQSKNSLVIFPLFSLSGNSDFTFLDGNTAINIQNLTEQVSGTKEL